MTIRFAHNTGSRTSLVHPHFNLNIEDVSFFYGAI
jgi:hypothetical protein